MEAAIGFENIRRVLKGETVFFPAAKVPLKELSTKDKVKYDVEAIYMDMTFFLLEYGNNVYIVHHQVPCRVYNGRKEMK